MVSKVFKGINVLDSELALGTMFTVYLVKLVTEPKYKGKGAEQQSGEHGVCGKLVTSVMSSCICQGVEWQGVEREFGCSKWRRNVPK